MIKLFGIAGLLVISFAVWLKNHRLQDVLFVCGGALLMVYSIYIGDPIFIILQGVFILSALLNIVTLKRGKRG